MSEEGIVQPGIHDISSALQRIQQRLLAMGYTYAAGNAERWPLTVVLMASADTTLLIAPCPLADMGALQAAWEHLSRVGGENGLLLVGVENIDSPLVTQFFTAVGGAVAYVDARSAQVRRHNGPGWMLPYPAVLQEKSLAALINPADDETAAIDCLAALHTQTAPHPVEEPHPAGSRPWFTYTLIALCVLTFVGQMLTLHRYGTVMNGLSSLLDIGALNGQAVSQGEWWRLITSAFLHIGIFHLGMNMLALYYLGAQLEMWQGRWRLAAFFLVSILAGSALALWWSSTNIALVHLLPVPWRPSPDDWSAGASGGIFGLLGAIAAVLLRFRRDFPAAMHKSLSGWLRSVLLINLVISLIPGISLAAHVGGFAGGFLLALLIARSPYHQTRVSVVC